MIRFIRSFLSEEKAQDAFEYLLVIGGVSVAIIIAMVTPVGSTIIEAVIEGVCDAINSIGDVGGVAGGLEITCPNL